MLKVDILNGYITVNGQVQFFPWTAKLIPFDKIEALHTPGAISLITPHVRLTADRGVRTCQLMQVQSRSHLCICVELKAEGKHTLKEVAVTLWKASLAPNGSLPL